MNLPETAGTIIADIERRVAALETAPRATNTSVREGLFTVLDSTGKKVLALGKQPGSEVGLEMFDAAAARRLAIGQIPGTPTKYGAMINDPNGTARFWVDDDGFHTPYLTTPFYDPAVFKPVTSAAFVEVYRARVELITHAGLYVWVIAAGDAATTGEIRIRCNTSGAVTDAVAVPAGGSVQQQFRWIHGVALQVGPVDFAIEARRTAGAGNINVYERSGLSMVGADNCTATGL